MRTRRQKNKRERGETTHTMRTLLTVLTDTPVIRRKGTRNSTLPNINEQFYIHNYELMYFVYPVILFIQLNINPRGSELPYDVHRVTYLRSLCSTP